MSKVIIVESPAKCKKIEGYLGSDYICIATYGHLRELNNLKNIDIHNNFKPTFNIIEKKKQQINKIKHAIKNREVYLATDDDREGEAIAWHLCDIFKLNINTTKRIIFHEITKTAILHAVNNPKRLNMNLVCAQQSRQILDLLVGFMISPMLWKHITRKSAKGLSAGRCQTPALKIVYDNHKDIENSKKELIYKVYGVFTKLNIEYELNNTFVTEEDTHDFLNKSISFQHKYSYTKEKEGSSKQPVPFTTSLIQQKANNEMRMSPKETMSICQKLYESGLITYMRTDSKFYSKEFITLAKKYISDEWGDNYIRSDINKITLNMESKHVKKDENAQEAHESIRPTNINLCDLKSMKYDHFSNREKKLYRLIWTNTIESCMSPAKYKYYKSIIKTVNDYKYEYMCRNIIYKGWMAVQGCDDNSEEYNYLRSIKLKSDIKSKLIHTKLSIKNMKMHYTEAKLVQLLEKKGIGRPSTFSSLIEKIQYREYVKRQDIKGKKIKCNKYTLEDGIIKTEIVEKEMGNENNKLVIQPLGILVVEFLEKYYDSIFNYSYTKKMENKLDVIASGKDIWYKLCKQCFNEINKLNVELKDNDRETIKIDNQHYYMIGQYGPVIKKIESDDNVSFLPVRQDIDINRLKMGKYVLSDIIKPKKEVIELGSYQEEKMYIKNGKYGLYAEWGDNRVSLKDFEGEKTLENVIKYIKSVNKKNKNILRTVTNNISIRKSKYGLYVFYKTSKMKKPKFYNLDKFNDNCLKCDVFVLKDWLHSTYGI